MTATFRRLCKIGGLEDKIVGLYAQVACFGPRIALHTTEAQAVRDAGGNLRTVNDVKAMIKDPVYLGLNTYGAEAFETPYTDANQIVPRELWIAAVARCEPQPSEGPESSKSLLEGIGLEMTMDSILNAAILLCRQCLAPFHRGRTQIVRGVRLPSLECSGGHIDWDRALKQVEAAGILTDEGLRKATITGSHVHEIKVLNVADAEGMLTCQVSCDKCGNRNLRRFSREDLRTRRRLKCLRCKWSKPLPREPWKPTEWYPPTEAPLDTFPSVGTAEPWVPPPALQPAKLDQYGQPAEGQA